MFGVTQQIRWDRPFPRTGCNLSCVADVTAGAWFGASRSSVVGCRSEGGQCVPDLVRRISPEAFVFWRSAQPKHDGLPRRTPPAESYAERIRLPLCSRQGATSFCGRAVRRQIGVFEDPRRKQRQRHDRPRFTHWRSSSRQKMPDGRLFSISGRYALRAVKGKSTRSGEPRTESAIMATLSPSSQPRRSAISHRRLAHVRWR